MNGAQTTMPERTANRASRRRAGQVRHRSLTLTSPRALRLGKSVEQAAAERAVRLARRRIDHASSP